MNEIELAMNPTIEEAIQRLEGMIFTSDLSLNTLRAVAVNKMALTALREKAEREKGCEYCEDDMEGAQIEGKGAGIHNVVTDGALYNYCQCGCHAVVAIHFCPMCGRKLKGE